MTSGEGETEAVWAFPSLSNPVMSNKQARIPVRQKMFDLGADCVDFMLGLILDGYFVPPIWGIPALQPISADSGKPCFRESVPMLRRISCVSEKFYRNFGTDRDYG